MWRKDRQTDREPQHRYRASIMSRGKSGFYKPTSKRLRKIDCTDVRACHYVPPGLWLPSQTQIITAFWPVPSYTAWWQRHIGVNKLPNVVTQLLSRAWFEPTTCWSQCQCSTRLLSHEKQWYTDGSFFSHSFLTEHQTNENNTSIWFFNNFLTKMFHCSVLIKISNSTHWIIYPDYNKTSRKKKQLNIKY